MLINHTINSVYNGVNQQAAEHRLDTQVEEMINVVPTIERGLLKRNPTSRINISGGSLNYTEDMWTYYYNRGGEEEEEYIFQITQAGGLKVIDARTGEILTVTYEGNSLSYLENISSYKNGFSAITIKDVTVLANKSVYPAMHELNTGDDSIATQTLENVNVSTVSFTENLNKPLLYSSQTETDVLPSLRPGHIYTATFFDGTTRYTLSELFTTIVVDGISTTIVHDYEFEGSTKTMLEYVGSVKTRLSQSLDTSLYAVTQNDLDLVIVKLDGTSPIVTVTLSAVDNFPVDTKAYTFLQSDFAPSSGTGSIETEVALTSHENYGKEAFIWIKSNNPVDTYRFNIDIRDGSATPVRADFGIKLDPAVETDVTPTAMATAIANEINTNYSASFSATASGSICRVTSLLNTIESVSVTDSFGNTASSCWSTEVVSSHDLPANMSDDFNNTLVKVTGSSRTNKDVYWLKYLDGRWVESMDNSIAKDLVVESMPHIIIRNEDRSFTLKPYGFNSREIGDDTTNERPSFIGSPIRDLFFFKNRMGFLTENSVVMSEVGEYGNFWRTTAVSVLDSDPIDTFVDSSSVVSLHHAVYIEDSVMLFSDNNQFRLEGGKVLGPSSVQITQVSAYQYDKNVRPLFIGNSIFFVAQNGEHSAVMEYALDKRSETMSAFSVSSHIPRYIPSNCVALSGSEINNMLFLFSESDRSTLYVYKYYDSGNKRHQSAWFKWNFNATMYNVLGLSNKILLLVNRRHNVAMEDWVLSSGKWDMSALWDNSLVWVNEPSSLQSVDQLERMDIVPQDHTSNFIDDSGHDNDTVIPALVNLGEWIPGTENKKDIDSDLRFKNINVTSEDGSSFYIDVHDSERGDVKSIPYKYTVDRKPVIYGNAKHVKIHIMNNDTSGFRINSISYEGSLNKTNRRY